MQDIAAIVFAALAAIAIVAVAFRVSLRLLSAYRLWRAEEEPLHSARAVIWRDPGPVGELDLAGGCGGPKGRPEPPFTFAEEHFTGSRPCVSVRDARGRMWRVKWGNEVRAEALATRLAWAAGFFVETTYFVAAGRIEETRDLKRAASAMDGDGSFANARFELDEDNVIKHFDEHSWSWVENPFIGTRELNGLKIVMMWLSNWDAKDVRDVALGSNTAIFEYRTPDGMREARYLVIDWGGSLGRWGSVVNRGRWDPAGFADETPQFVLGVNGDFVQWGYAGRRTADIAARIPVSDARWLVDRLSGLRPEQIRDAVRASGGTAEDGALFARALLERLQRLRSVVIANPSAIPADVPSATAP